MNSVSNSKRFVPHLAAFIIFLAISAFFFLPVLSGKILIQNDILKFKGMSHEIEQHREQYGEEPLWTNSMFGGMPTYQISMRDKGNFFDAVNKVVGLGLPRPINYLFLAMLSFYIMMLCFRVNPWIAIAGAIAYGLGTYFISFIEAGHTSKAHAVAYMPLIIGGVRLLFNRRYWPGIALTGAGMALQISVNHIQITYYLMMAVGLMVISELFFAVREKRISDWAKALGLFLLCVVLAVGSTATILLTTYEYTDASIRGSSEIAPPDEKTGGLDKDYAFSWSYGVLESFTLLYPNFAGGASSKSFLEDEGSNTLNVLQRINQNDQQAARQLQQFSSKYWGMLPFTSGPVYVGAIICFLFLLGAAYAEGRMKTWLIAASVLSLFLSWGSHFPAFNYFLFDYFPMYNKFRTVMMGLVIADLTMPLLGMWALNEFLRNNKKENQQKKIKALTIAGGIIGLISLLFLMPGIFSDLLSPREELIQSQNPNNPNIGMLFGALKSDREQMIRMDVLRSVFFVAVSAGLIFGFLKDKLKANWVIAGIGLLILLDLGSVAKQYLNEENFGDRDYYEQVFAQSNPVINDSDPNFRVFNTTRRLDQDGITPYDYKSLGGYHGAKIRRYQDVIDRYLTAPDNIDEKVVNMLNTKYVILQDREGRTVYQKNPGALGNAWFVNTVQFTNTPLEELEALGNIEPAYKAVSNKENEKNLSNYSLDTTFSGNIRLTQYKANHLIYESNSNKDALAVFSEIFYNGNKDWKAYIDGTYQDHFRVDYILRGMIIPAGKHSIEFKFEPPTYYMGKTISRISSALLLLIVLGSLGMTLKNADLQNLTKKSITSK